MTDKAEGGFPPDAITKRYRDQLVPASAVGVPKPILEASEQLRVAGLAAEAAVVRRRAADEAKRTGRRSIRRPGSPP